MELFIESLGFDAILFEKGDIAFHPDFALDESCYREAESADIFVLIIGGRYGSKTSESNDSRRPMFFDTYKSITEKEFETAQDADVPTFILLDKSVHAEYQTYLKNKDNEKIKYAHVDSINVFKLIEAIFARNKNNPVLNFERASDIESWLRDQWSGLFRELLRTRSQQKQLSALNFQVRELQSVNETLKKYLEAVLGKVVPGSETIIKIEQEKLENNKVNNELMNNPFYSHFVNSHKIQASTMREIIEFSTDAEDLVARLDAILSENNDKCGVLRGRRAREDFNKLRGLLQKSPIDFSDLDRNYSKYRSKFSRALGTRDPLKMPEESKDDTSSG